MIVSAPTGAGKTLVAEYAIERCIERKARVIYTSPIKALSNQKFRDFRATYGDAIGLMTGDVTINPDAPVLIMTTEIFRNTIFESEDRFRDAELVIIDEIHYIDDDERGTVWEESIIFAPKNVRFVGLSATISNLEQFRAWVEKVCRAPGRPREDRRAAGAAPPLRLRARGRAVPHLRSERGHPAREAAQEEPPLPEARHPRPAPAREAPPVPLLLLLAQGVRGARAREPAPRAARRRGRAPGAWRTSTSSAPRYQVTGQRGFSELRQLASRGVLFHHAGMLPIYKEIVERLFTSGLIKLLFTTETFALGVNMPAKVVVFSSPAQVRRRRVRLPPHAQLLPDGGARRPPGNRRRGHGLLDHRLRLRHAEGRQARHLQQDRADHQQVQPLVRCDALALRAHGAGDLRRGRPLVRGVPARRRAAQAERAALQKRLAVLEKRATSRARPSRPKGRFAAKINAYEIHIAELFWAGRVREPRARRDGDRRRRDRVRGAARRPPRALRVREGHARSRTRR